MTTSRVAGDFHTRATNRNTVGAEANLAWDLSGLLIGNPVYLVHIDVSAAGGDQTDVLVCTSTDGGQTWSAPARISDGVASTKILPAVAVDPTSGYVAAAWYDTRNDNKRGDSDVDVYATIGVPGGTWLADRKLSTGTSNARRADDPKDFGDYEGVAAYGGSFWYCWADNSGAFKRNETKFDVVTRKVDFNRFGKFATGLEPTGGAPLEGVANPPAIGIHAARETPPQGVGSELLPSAVADDFLALLALWTPDRKTAGVLASIGRAGDPSLLLGPSRLECETELVNGLLSVDATFLVDLETT